MSDTILPFCRLESSGQNHKYWLFDKLADCKLRKVVWLGGRGRTRHTDFFLSKLATVETNPTPFRRMTCMSS